MPCAFLIILIGHKLDYADNNDCQQKWNLKDSGRPACGLDFADNIVLLSYIQNQMHDNLNALDEIL